MRPVSAGENGGGRHGGDAFATACEAEPFGGGGLDTDAAYVESEVVRHILSHPGYMRQHFRSLGHDGDVDVMRSKAGPAENRHYLAQKHPRVGPFPLRICVGEVCADIAEGGGAEECVAQGVECDVGITVAEKAFLVWNVYAADNAAATFDKAMHIEAIAGSEVGKSIHLRLPRRSRRPSISNVREKRSVWSRGDVCAVAIM